MSIPYSNEKIFEKAALKIFRRQNRKSQNAPKPLRLPDSAVSAKTRNGARHIAISIPIEYEYLGEKASPVKRYTLQGHKRSSSPPRAVVVLKPFVSSSAATDIRESRPQTSRFNTHTKRDSRNVILEASPTAIDKVPDRDGNKTSRYNSNTQLSDPENQNSNHFVPQKCK